MVSLYTVIAIYIILTDYKLSKTFYFLRIKAGKGEGLM